MASAAVWWDLLSIMEQRMIFGLGQSDPLVKGLEESMGSVKQGNWRKNCALLCTLK